MKEDIFTYFTSFLKNLERGKIHYTLQSNRDHAVMVIATVPGERWEIEFFADGSVEVERFISDGEIYGEDILSELLKKYADPEFDNVEQPQEDILNATLEQNSKSKALRKI